MDSWCEAQSRAPAPTEPARSALLIGGLVPGAVLVWFGFCLDDVGIGTCIAVVSPDPVVIERVRSQTSHVLTGSGHK